MGLDIALFICACGIIGGLAYVVLSGHDPKSEERSTGCMKVVLFCVAMVIILVCAQFCTHCPNTNSSSSSTEYYNPRFEDPLSE